VICNSHTIRTETSHNIRHRGQLRKMRWFYSSLYRRV